MIAAVVLVVEPFTVVLTHTSRVGYQNDVGALHLRRFAELYSWCLCLSLQFFVLCLFLVVYPLGLVQKSVVCHSLYSP